MDDALKVIKSLLTTSSDGGLLVKEINNEYKEMVGTSIPFQEFGFTTLTDFLRSTNEFSGTKTANGIRVSIKIAGKSAHIIAMRQKQNVSGSEMKRRKKATARGGGANLSQQPKRSTSSYVMRRTSGGHVNISKPRLRAQPQRIAGFNSTVKPVTPPRRIEPNTAVQQRNRPSVKAAEPSQKSNLHDRMVPKNHTEPTTKPAVFEPLTPPISPAKVDHKLSTPPTSFGRSAIMARLASAQNKSSIGSQISSDKSVLQTPSTPSDGQSCGSELSAPLTPKQPLEKPNALQRGRQMLKNLVLKNQHENSPPVTQLKVNGSSNIANGGGDEHQQKAFDLRSRLQSKTVLSDKTMTCSNLHARLAPKVTDVESNNMDQSTTNTLRTTVSQNDKKADIHSRLPLKKIDEQLPEIQQIDQMVREMHFSFISLYFPLETVDFSGIFH